MTEENTVTEKKKFLTPKALAERWDWKVNTLYTRRRKQLPPGYIKLGKSKQSPVRYPIEEVEKFEQENEIGPVNN